MNSLIIHLFDNKYIIRERPKEKARGSDVKMKKHFKVRIKREM